MKRSGDVWKVSRNLTWRVERAGAALLLLLLLCLAAKDSVSAKGKAYVAVFYRTFKDEEDPEAADVRAALNKALEDAGIAYREYDGENNPLIQLMQIVQEKDAMLLIVNPAEQSFRDTGEKAGEETERETEKETEKNTAADTGADVAADIIVQTDGRPLIFFDCEISEKTAEMTEELCVLVNAVELQSEAETETELTRAEIIAAEFQSEAEAETEVTRAEIIAEESQLEAETEQGAEIETETETEFMPPEKNIQGMADVIALIAGNYMTGAGYFEGLEEDWVIDEWRVDVPYWF